MNGSVTFFSEQAIEVLSGARNLVGGAEELNDRDHAVARTDIDDFEVALRDRLAVERKKDHILHGHVRVGCRGAARGGSARILHHVNVGKDGAGLSRIGLDEHPFFHPRAQVVGQIGLELVPRVGDQPMMHVPPELLQVGVHSWKGALGWHSTVSQVA